MKTTFLILAFLVFWCPSTRAAPLIIDDFAYGDDTEARALGTAVAVVAAIVPERA